MPHDGLYDDAVAPPIHRLSHAGVIGPLKKPSARFGFLVLQEIERAALCDSRIHWFVAFRLLYPARREGRFRRSVGRCKVYCVRTLRADAAIT